MERRARTPCFVVARNIDQKFGIFSAFWDHVRFLGWEPRLFFGLTFVYLVTQAFHQTSFGRTGDHHWDMADRIVQSYFGENEEFYRQGLVLGQVDPLYARVAAALGGVVVFGGSDIADILLGSRAKVSNIDINVLHPRVESAIERFKIPERTFGRLFPNAKLIGFERNHLSTWNFEIRVAAPPFANRSSSTESIYLNFGEAKFAVDAMRKASYDYHSIFSAINLRQRTSELASLMAPLKRAYLVQVDENGRARLLFRTARDLDDFERKIIRLPFDSHYELSTARAWHRQLEPAEIARYYLPYALTILARGYDQGWRFSRETQAIVRTWIDYVSNSSGRARNSLSRTLTETLTQRAAQQGYTLETLRAVLRSVGVDNSDKSVRGTGRTSDIPFCIGRFAQ